MHYEYGEHHPRFEGCLKKKKAHRKTSKDATLIAYELKLFSWRPFSLTVYKTCTEIERNTKEPTVSKKFHSISG